MIKKFENQTAGLLKMKNSKVINNNIRGYFSYLLITLLLIIAQPVTADSGATLMVTPSRVVFDERTRSAQVTLMNTGSEAGTFRVSFIRQNMTEDGQFVAVKDNEKGMFSDPMIRFSPKQLILPPGQSQVVRMMLRKPKNLAEGEYRSHMLLQNLPKASGTSLEDTLKAKEENTIKVEIIPVVGISIPVIVRHGKLDDGLTIDNAKLVPGTEANPRASISVDMHRKGNRSVYGDFRAIFIPNDGDEPTVIALANGVAVYTPNVLRHFSIPITAPAGTRFNDGTIRIIFLESGKDEDTGLIAETKLSLQ
jgi:hypothetical protein